MQRFINTCIILHEARSQIYIANDYKKLEKLGVAVGILRYAMNRLQGKSPGKVLHAIIMRMASVYLKNHHQTEIWNKFRYLFSDLGSINYLFMFILRVLLYKGVVGPACVGF